MIWLIVLIFVAINVITLTLSVRRYLKLKAKCKKLEDRVKCIGDINHRVISNNLSINRKIGCINYNRSILNEDIMRNHDNLHFIVEQMKHEFGAEIAEKCVNWKVFDDPISKIRVVKGQLYYVDDGKEV